MTIDIVLVYPYINEEFDRSIFRYPPLGLGYLASTLLKAGIKTDLIDCTFSNIPSTLKKIREMDPRVVGIYSMVTMNHNAIAIAQQLKNEFDLLIAGGPLPTLVPTDFLDVFNVVVMGEGEKTLLDLMNRFLNGKSWDNLKGIGFKTQDNKININPRSQLLDNLDLIPFPARKLFPNKKYKWYWRTFHKFTVTNIISTRGCPFQCDFCSNPIFGTSYRERSLQNVFEEMMEIRELGYENIFFADDCFTLNPKRIEAFCDLLVKERFDLEWMCLSRSDKLSANMTRKMRRAGCKRIFFGIEAGNSRMLKEMNKQITLQKARSSVLAAHEAGIETGAFFILGYPGETNESLIDTLHFSSSLPLEYLSYSLPYPIYGTGLYDKVKNQITRPEWRKHRGSANWHDLLFKAPFSVTKLRFAIRKGKLQHWLKQHGNFGKIAANIFEKFTDFLLKRLR